MDQVMKLIHFIHVSTTKDVGFLAKKYVQQNVTIHEVPQCIVSNRDNLFASAF